MIRRYDASLKMVIILKSMYKSVKRCIRVNIKLSHFFESSSGVKQEGPLSPLLDVYDILKNL